MRPPALDLPYSPTPGLARLALRQTAREHRYFGHLWLWMAASLFLLCLDAGNGFRELPGLVLASMWGGAVLVHHHRALKVGRRRFLQPHSDLARTAQTAEEREKFGVNIYVYPNPATREALAQYQQLNPNGEDPTGIRVTFTNLPQANNTIQIYTVSGDLVQTISHSGLEGSGHASWNLMSRNGQEIVSGVYLYSVQSDDSAFEDFVGKFVVVR